MKRILLSASMAALASWGADLHIHPQRIELSGRDATQSYIVSYTDEHGYARDVTAECAPHNVARASMKNITVNCRGMMVSAPIFVKPATRQPGVSFLRDVSPIFTMSGCAGANCHGSIRGQRGFKLSLFGYEPKLDMEALTGGKQPRVQVKDPEKSLVLAKATAQVAHGGGLRFAVDSLQYRTILDWVRQGAPYDADGSVRVTELRVYPEERVLTGVGETQQLVATARYSDGSVRDMTGLVQYSANNPDCVQVDAKGLVRSLQTCETAVMVRTMGQAVAVRVMVGKGVPGADYPPVAAQGNVIDREVFGKLRRLNIKPSALSSDEQFLRRAYLDTIGLLPTADEARTFLAASDTGKRERLIEKLLQRPEFADVWALKFTELFRAGTREAGAKGAKIVFDYLRQSFRAAKPYDQLVRELVLSQGAHSFPNSSLDGVPLAPTSFYNISFDSNAPDHATNISQVFLGVRLECAKCHNHPWEKWTQDDFYGFAAFFARVGIKEVYENDENATQYMEEGFVEHPKTKQLVTARFLDGGTVRDEQDKDIREDLVAWMTSPRNPFFAKTIVNRVWKHFMGRGLVEEVDDFRVTNPPTHPALLDALARDLADHGYDLRRLMRLILTSRAYQLSAEPNGSNRDDTMNYSRFLIRRLPAEAMLDAMSQATGVPEKFAGYPPGTRAMQLYSGAGGYMLASFGRLNRDIICERDSQPDMAQTMHLIAGSTIEKKVGGAKLDWAMTDEELVERLYLSALTRRPSEAERSAVFTRIAQGNRKAAYQDLLWALLNSKEFLYQH